MLAITSHAAPLLISGTGGLQPGVDYQEPDPLFGGPASLTFTEKFADVPATLNTSGVSDYIQLTLAAPAGYMFIIAADTTVSISVLYYNNSSNIGLAKAGASTITYDGFGGSAPIWIDNTAIWTGGFSFTLGTIAAEEFSFTSMTITMPISGVGQDVTLRDNGDHQLNAQQGNYTGNPPPNETILLSVNAVPEPGSFWLAVAGLGLFFALSHWKHTRQGV